MSYVAVNWVMLTVSTQTVTRHYSSVAINAMRGEPDFGLCKHKMQLHERESTFRSLVRLKDAAKVVYIMLRDNRGVYTARLKLRYVAASFLVTIYRSRGRL